MAGRLVQREDDVSKIPSSLQSIHDAAAERFRADPSKAYQRHIREIYGELEGREQLPSLSGARVEKITTNEAESIILKFEWLRSMGSGTIASYGLRLGDELWGAVCFGCLGGNIRKICLGDTEKETDELADQTLCLTRGACAPWAPRNSASYLIRHACRKAHEDLGSRIFFAYSDIAAGEIGTVYQAVGFLFIGDSFRKGKYHTDYRSRDGKRTVTSYAVNHGRIKRAKLLADGWTPIPRYNKRKYLWFEGSRTEREFLKSRCRYAFLPYPKRLAVDRRNSLMSRPPL
jgi:hypothetical protein